MSEAIKYVNCIVHNPVVHRMNSFQLGIIIFNSTATRYEIAVP